MFSQSSVVSALSQSKVSRSIKQSRGEVLISLNFLAGVFILFQALSPGGFYAFYGDRSIVSLREAGFVRGAREFSLLRAAVFSLIALRASLFPQFPDIIRINCRFKISTRRLKHTKRQLRARFLLRHGADNVPPLSQKHRTNNVS